MCISSKDQKDWGTRDEGSRFVNDTLIDRQLEMD